MFIFFMCCGQAFAQSCIFVKTGSFRSFALAQKYLLILDDSGLSLLEIPSCREVKRLHFGKHKYEKVALLDDRILFLIRGSRIEKRDFETSGRYFASGSEGRGIKIWETRTGKIMRTLSLRYHTFDRP